MAGELSTTDDIGTAGTAHGSRTTVGAPTGRLTRARGQVAAETRAAGLRLIACALLLWAALCGAGWLLTRPLADTGFERWDGSVDRWFSRHHTAGWNTVTHYLTFCAETTTVIALAAVAFIGLRVGLGRWRESLFVAIALAGEVTIFVSTTLMIDRKRPAVPHLDAAPPTSSFPSGHTAAAFTLYGSLAIVALAVSTRVWLRTVAVAVAVVVPVSVAFARMYRGMHYPTDVTGGALLALTWLSVTALIVLRARGDRSARQEAHAALGGLRR